MSADSMKALTKTIIVQTWCISRKKPYFSKTGENEARAATSKNGSKMLLLQAKRLGDWNVQPQPSMRKIVLFNNWLFHIAAL